MITPLTPGFPNSLHEFHVQTIHCVILPKSGFRHIEVLGTLGSRGIKEDLDYANLYTNQRFFSMKVKEIKKSELFSDLYPYST